MKVRPAIILIFLCAVCAVCAVGQSPSKILEKANKALGGDKALKAVTSVQLSGRITRTSDGAGGNYTASSAGGNLYGESYDLAGFEVATGYNGKSGWLRDSKNGLRTMTGEASKEFQAEAIFRNSRWLKAKDDKAKLTAAGTAVVDARPANVVMMTTGKGVRLKLYFDSTTGLPLCEELQQGTGIKALEYADYRGIGGIQTPHHIKSNVDGETYDIKLESVRYNQSVPRSIFDFPVVSTEPLPDIPTLLNEIRANAARNEEILENYSYTEMRVEREMKDTGEVVTKSSEKRLLTFYKGRRITRTIEKNGKPLSPSEQAKEDKEAEKYVAEIEKQVAERERKLAADDKEPENQVRRFTILEALKGSLLVNPRRERFTGRDVIVFDFEPNPAYKPKNLNEKIFALCTGAVWVDASAKQVVRLDATLTKTAGSFMVKAKRGTSFTLENAIVNNEIWLPSRADINLQIKLLFLGINLNQLVTYGDYRRFETEVKGAVVGDEKKP